MALGTGYPGMLAVKFEGGSVVVIIHFFPFLDTVTTLAVGRTIIFKLPAVYVFVTGDALAADWRKDYFGLRCSIRLVTGTTGYPVVRTFQLECCCAVIETGGSPAFGDVTLVAVLFGVVLFLKCVLVDVFVTVHTSLTNISELPFRLFRLIQVAGETGCGYVRACEREVCFFVFRHTEQGVVKSVYIMTFGTIPVLVCTGEYCFMVILVARKAVAEFQRFDKVGEVTVLAIYCSMPAQQREICIGMVEILRHAGYFEALFVMARFTLPAELSLVDVFVAYNTIRIFYTRSVLKYLRYRNIQIMAVLATDGLVLARERKSCLVVVEFVVQNFESLLGMAFLAVVAQFVPVHVLVTTVAIGVGYTREALKFGVIPCLFRVTFYAAHIFVFSGQRIMRLFVSESGGWRKVVGGMTLGAVDG